jgi:hypothetical protein
LAAHHLAMTTKSRESIYGSSIRASAELAKEARKEADRLACVAWNQRMLGYQGPAQPSPALGDALNAGYHYLEVKCLGCNTHQTVPLNIVRRTPTQPSGGAAAVGSARTIQIGHGWANAPLAAVALARPARSATPQRNNRAGDAKRLSG